MTNDWRERMKEKRRALDKQRRAELATDPRVLAMKQALKERRRAASEQTKQRRKAGVQDRKKREHERVTEERAARGQELRKKVRPATTPDEGP